MRAAGEDTLEPRRRASLLQNREHVLREDPANDLPNGRKEPFTSCQSRRSFLEAFSSSTSGTRELIWSLMHSGMMPPDVAVTLLDLEERGSSEQLRKQSTEWISATSGACKSTDLCHTLSKMLTATDEFSCPTASVLAQIQQQLDVTWSMPVGGRERGTTNSLLHSSNLTGRQLAIKRWGIRLMGHATTNHQAAHRLDYLVNGIELPDGDIDLLHLVRQFLKGVEKNMRTPRHLSKTGSPDNLLGLLRLLHEQRAQATADVLVSDAVVIDFYEKRIGELEERWAQIDAECSSRCMSRPVLLQTGVSACTKLKAEVGSLSAVLSRLAADHATVLPADAGALPAYWTGRLERVRRRLAGVRSGEGLRATTVLIWTCSYGGGHRAAMKAVEGYLPDFTTIITDPSRDREYYEGDTIGNWIRRFIQPEWDETYVFNQFILRDKLYPVQRTVEYLQALRGWLRGDGTRFARPCQAPTCDTAVKKKMRRVLLRTSPDFVITVYHHDLLPIAELCHELGGLPLMHLSTDADAKMYEVFGKRPAYPNLRVGLPFDVPEAWPTLMPLARSQTFVSGYSVRMPFLRPLPTEAERREERLRRQVRQGAQVVLVMSGSEGQSVDWPMRLAESDTWKDPLHVIVVAARNRDFGARLESQLAPVLESAGGAQRFHGRNHHVIVEVARDPAGNSGGAAGSSLYYLPEGEVSTLMDIADVLITKAGGSTVAEAAYRGIPVIFDATSGMLRWEDFNARVFEAHGRGIRMVNVADLEDNMREAFGLGRHRPLICDWHNGQTIDSRRQIRHEMQKMLAAFASKQRHT